MPSKPAHIAAAKRNAATADFLLSDGDNHLAWAATVIFYEALHVVEALLAIDTQCNISHTDDHSTRNGLLKTTPRYAQIWRMYRPLYQASLIARYLRENNNAPTYEVFDQYMSKSQVQSKLRGHYLRQLKASAARLVNDPNFMEDDDPVDGSLNPS